MVISFELLKPYYIKIAMSLSDFPALKNDTILRVCKGEPVERTPIWIMRQAG